MFDFGLLWVSFWTFVGYDNVKRRPLSKKRCSLSSLRSESWSLWGLEAHFLIKKNDVGLILLDVGSMLLNVLSIWAPNRFQDLKNCKNIHTINLYENGDPALPPGGSQCAGSLPQRG